MPLPILMQTSVVVPHYNLNPFQKVFHTANNKASGVDYIKKYIDTISNRKISGVGDKVLILKSGTGSGKSTTLPVALVDRGRRIAVAVPTKIIAEQTPGEIVKWNPQFKMGVNVGFQTGSIKKGPPKGILFTPPQTIQQQLLNMEEDQFLRRYSTILIDEVHKHPIGEDFLLAGLKQLLMRNYENKDCPIIILMSGTLEAKKYMDYFDTTHYIETVNQDTAEITEVFPKNDVADLKTYVKKILPNITGDILVFLPGAGMIRDFKAEFDGMEGLDYVSEVHSSAVKDDNYRKLFVQDGQRLILATNAAETGITFPFLKNVFDTGLVRSVSFNPVYGASVNYITSATKASAQQRRGRVGRGIPGTWYPCFTRETYEKTMLKEAHPEIYVGEITEYLLSHIIQEVEFVIGSDEKDEDDKFLSIKKLKFTSGSSFNPLTLDLIHNIPTEMLQFCMEKLYTLGLISPVKNGGIGKWRPTLAGYLCGSSMVKISIENRRAILAAASINQASVKYMIMIACCMANQVSRLPEFKKAGVKYTNNNSFMHLIYIFQMIEEYMSEIRLPSDVKKWFLSNKLNYPSWMYVFEMYHETITSLSRLGVKMKNVARYEIKIWDESLQTDIVRALYEGYRLNLLERDDSINGYRSQRGVEFPNVRHPMLGGKDQYTPQRIIVDSINYAMSPGGKMNYFLAPYAYVCDVSNIPVDPNF